MSDPEQRADLPASLRRIVDSLLAMAQNRAQLFALELQTEKLRWASAGLWLCGVAILAGTGFVIGATALTLCVWQFAGLAGLAGLSGAFLGLAAIAFLRLRDRLRSSPPPFADTIEEFRKDRSCLATRD